MSSPFDMSNIPEAPKRVGIPVPPFPTTLRGSQGPEQSRVTIRNPESALESWWWLGPLKKKKMKLPANYREEDNPRGLPPPRFDSPQPRREGQHPSQSQSPAQQLQQLPAPDLNSMMWAVEIGRLQSLEISLGIKVDDLTNRLGDTLEKNVKLSQQQILLETQKENLNKKLNNLQIDKKNLDANNSKLKSDCKSLQNDLRSKETENDHQVGLLKERIKNLKIERDSWQRDCGTLEQGRKRDVERLEEAIKKKERRIELMEAEEQSRKLEIRSLHDEQIRMKSANSTLNDHLFRSKTEINRLQAHSNRQDSEIESLTQAQYKANSDIEKLNKELEQSQKDCAHHRYDAEKLREYIAKGESQRGPIRDENYYVQNFEELKAEIQNWIARNAKANATQELSDKHECALLQSLSNLGEHGEVAARYLSANNRMRRWYSAPRWRIPMVRHIVAAFLFAYAFHPFVVGLPAESSEMLEWIDRDIASHERQFNKVLTIRQSLGKAAVRYVQAYGQDQQDDFTAQLVHILLLLFPKAADADIVKGVTKFVTKAIKFKHEMAEEQAVYNCYWVNGGERLDENNVEIEGDDTGTISVCTFPGLSRTVKNDDGELVANAVKASALLEGAFEE